MNLSAEISPSRQELSGCFKGLRILDLSGNNMDESNLDSEGLLSIFDFLESIEEFNIERLKFDSFKTFNKMFLMGFVGS
jgi:hypothetical protein